MNHLIVLFSVFSILTGQAQSTSVASPNDKLTFTLNTDERSDGALVYSIQYSDQMVVDNAPIGVILKNRDWTQKLETTASNITAKDTAWQPVYGERSSIPDRYRELIVDLNPVGNTKLLMQLVVRAYNEGIAFRYHWPEQLGMQILEVVDERTYFKFPKGTKAWYTPRAQAEYELRPIQNWKSATEMPLTLILPSGLYASIAEANMVNYARSRLSTVPNSANLLVTEQAGNVVETSPFSTPWRVVLVAEEPGQLLEHNYIILNLNPPNALKNTDWIKPGKVIREMTLSTHGAKALADFASSHGLDYIHFDAGWYGYEYTANSDATTITVDPRRNPKGDLDLLEAIRYAKSKGLGVIVYVNHRALERQMDEIFPLYQQWGISGVKFGFVHVGSHRWTTWLYDAVKKAAKHQLMVDVHDALRPTGYSRTYPNLMTQEGIYGNEEMPDATQNTTLPFTRFVAGAADYTPAYYHRKEFKDVSRFIKNTPAHQLALPVIYYSPLQWLYWYDIPSRDYQGEPEVEFWEHCPTVWDDTEVLEGKIGEYIAVARQSNEEWYIGAITNTESRTLTIPFYFLPEGQTYTAHIYADSDTIKTRTKVSINQMKVTTDSLWETTLKPSGGVAIRLVPLEE